MYYLFKKYSLNISARSIQVLTPIIQFDNSFTQTWKHLRHFFTIWMTLMTSWGKSHQKHDILSKFHGKYSNCGEATLVTIYHVMKEANQKKKLNFLLSLTFSLKFPQSIKIPENEMECEEAERAVTVGRVLILPESPGCYWSLPWMGIHELSITHMLRLYGYVKLLEILLWNSHSRTWAIQILIQIWRGMKKLRCDGYVY